MRGKRGTDLRLAAYVALGELRMPGVIADIVTHVQREDDPRVLGAASNALVASLPEAAALAALAPRATELVGSLDPRMREVGAELAGLLGGAVPAALLVPLVRDDAAPVRGAAAWALGRLGDRASEPALLAAYRDDDAAVSERAAAALLALGTPAGIAAAIAYVASDGDTTTRCELAANIRIPAAHAAALGIAIDAALAHADHDDAAYEPLLRIKLAALLARAELGGGAAVATDLDVDAEIAAVFPSFAQLAKLRGFDALVRSLRTAESLYQSSREMRDADLSPRSRCG